ncbi:sulfur oxidation c-type cytochrome SoxX [Nitratireductor pacificus]|uniref:Monoheme cytochrome c SoxX n=1 Tax=Nitratireductor pacificus pht-3B TaxID=391937 RepID=K2M8N9_9HYPH|nr:sulfur oxidation c-type cytochrome SoxX [Nitratireductor pacificus]EKF17365.1 Monoheme cytochrome c SoxX [Nitratireductor pacificus pht-3B]
MIKVTRFLCAAFVMHAGAAFADDTAPDKVMYEDFSVQASLTGKAGDPVEGAKVFKDRGLGNCLACHQNADMSGDLFHGTVGPAVDGVADRWEPAQLRAIVSDAKQVFGEETVMPGFYSLKVGKDVAKDKAGKTILSAQQVEDVVAYLATLKE